MFRVPSIGDFAPSLPLAHRDNVSHEHSGLITNNQKNTRTSDTFVFLYVKHRRRLPQATESTVGRRCKIRIMNPTNCCFRNA